MTARVLSIRNEKGTARSLAYKAPGIRPFFIVSHPFIANAMPAITNDRLTTQNSRVIMENINFSAAFTYLSPER
jgi:hypothetical protein